MKKSPPLARNSEILLQELDEETLVYDLRTNKVSCLNKTSSLVWQNCDGKKDVSEISDILSIKLNTLVNEDFVKLALIQLSKENLLDSKPLVDEFEGISRRKLIKKIGFTSMIALPLISTIVAPKAIAQTSPTPSCTSPNDCITNCCGQEVVGGPNVCIPNDGRCI